MARLLFTVKEAFFIDGRGVVPLPGIVPIESECFRIGDSVMLKRADGTEFNWRIDGIEMLSPTPPNPAVVIVLKGLTEQDVPIGTEVWSVD